MKKIIKKSVEKKVTDIITSEKKPRPGELTLTEQIANLADINAIEGMIGNFSDLTEETIPWQGTSPSGGVSTVVEAFNCVASYIGNIDSYLAPLHSFVGSSGGEETPTWGDDVHYLSEQGSLLDGLLRLDSSIFDVAEGVGDLTGFVGSWDGSSTPEGTYLNSSTSVIENLIGLDAGLISLTELIGDTSSSSPSWSSGGGTVIGAIENLDTLVGTNQADISTLNDFTGFTDWDSNKANTNYGTASDSLFAWVQNIDSNLYSLPDSYTITVETQAQPNQGYAASYNITQGGNTIGTINIPKDFLVKSATLETVSTADQPVAGYVVGQKYIDFVINTTDSSETAQHIYLLVNDLVDVYTAQQNAAQVQLTVSSSNVISASIVAGSIGTTELSSGVNASLALADSAIQGATDSAQIDMTVTNKNISATIIAGAVGTAELASNAVTAAKIADSNVTTAKIADANVTTAKLADDAVTAAKIADGAVGTAAIAIEDEDVPGDIYTVTIKSGRLIIRKIASAD